MGNENLPCRILKPEDLPIRVAWINNTAFSRVLEVKTPVTLGGARTWFNANKDSEMRKDLALEKDGEIRAFGGFTKTRPKDGTAFIYTFVYPSLINLGLRIDAIESICSYGFYKLGLNKICLSINSDDLAMILAYEKVGFYAEGPEYRDSLPADYNGPLYYSLNEQKFFCHILGIIQ